jgi:type IV pilus assembly protein PilB
MQGGLPADEELLKRIGLRNGVQFYKGKGCKFCNGTGYSGRIGIFELLIPDSNVSKLVSQRVPAEQIKQYCLKRGDFDTLRRDGLRKVLEGLTTIDQVLGATQNDTI